MRILNLQMLEFGVVDEVKMIVDPSHDNAVIQLGAIDRRRKRGVESNVAR